MCESVKWDPQLDKDPNADVAFITKNKGAILDPSTLQDLNERSPLN